MMRLVTRRAAAMVGVLLVLVAAVFVLQRVSPVDPARAMVGANASRASVAQARRDLGLDQTVVVQYERYVEHLAKGQLGDSLHTRRPVTDDLRDFLPPTIELVAFAMFLAAIGGTLLGLVSAMGWRGAGLLRLSLVSFSAMPVFLLTIGAIIIFYKDLGWLPASGQTSVVAPPTGPTRLLVIDSLLHARFDAFADVLRHMLIPGLALAVTPAVAIGRVLRSSLLTTMESDHIRTARAKGLGERRVVLKHALRNSVGPVLAVAGVQLAVLFASDIVVEAIVGWPGIGLYVVQSINASDFPAIAGVTLVFGAAYVLVNTVVDLLQAAADPRIARA